MRPWFSAVALFVAGACSAVEDPPASGPGGEIREAADASTASDAGGPDAELGAPDAGLEGPDAGPFDLAGGNDIGPLDLGVQDAGASCAPATGEPGVVDTTEGAVRGVPADGERTWVFRGIHYAAPPVGARRWAPPAPPECRASVYSADRFGPRCPQADDGQPVGAEDCLHLNIWTLSTALTGPPRPVLFFIHGGGNAQGSTVEGTPTQILYDGRFLSETHGVVVVTINYRLGALGYLVHPDLDGPVPSGNYGIQDQIRALEWVRDNIRGFGGDPDRVMIFGESAGARNTCILVSSPLARGLFSAALMQSGACLARDRADVLMRSATQIAASGCMGAVEGEIACLRTRTAEAIIRDNPPVVTVGGANMNPGPYVDGRVIPEQPHAAIRAGRHNRVPFVIGANADETARSAPQIPTVAAYEALIRAELRGLADPVLALYPASAFPSPRDAYVAVTTDAQFVCNARADARDAARGQTEPVYRYFWTQGLDASPRLAAFGAYHAVELFFVWDNLTLAGYAPTAEESSLARTVGGYWTSLAARGDPNGPGRPTWPTYDHVVDPSLVLDAGGTEVQNGVRNERCDFWDRVTGR